MISIVTDIAFRNTKTYPVISAILSKLFYRIEDETKRKEVIETVVKKLKKLPNTGYFEIWIQRAVYKYNFKIFFEEDICRIMNAENIKLWTNDWILENSKLLGILETKNIIKWDELEEFNYIIENNEVALFSDGYQ